MISVIISSQKKALLEEVTKNIEVTIGVPFEIISIENSNGKMGICEAYNSGAAKASFDILCFMHEDVSFETVGWGKNVVTHLSDMEVGLIGVAGGDTKSVVPSSWSSSVFQSEISIIQHSRDSAVPPQRIVKTGYPNNTATIKNVVCIDGVWMCTRKDIFEKHQFDSVVFKGFHGYDIDFSLQVFSQYRVCVIFDVLLHHYSEGNYSKVWIESAVMISKKWRGILPLSVRGLSKKELITQHWTAMSVFLEKLNLLNYSLPQILTYYCRYSFNRFFHLLHFLHFLKLIFLNYLKNDKSLSIK